MLLAEDEILLVEDDTVGGAQGQVGTGSEEVLFQVLVPDESIVHAFCEVTKTSNNSVIPAGVSITGC